MVWLVRKGHLVARRLLTYEYWLLCWKWLDTKILSLACHECYVYIEQPTLKLLLLGQHDYVSTGYVPQFRPNCQAQRIRLAILILRTGRLPCFEIVLWARTTRRASLDRAWSKEACGNTCKSA